MQCLSRSVNNEPVILNHIITSLGMVVCRHVSCVNADRGVLLPKVLMCDIGLQFALQIWVQASVLEIFKPPL